MNNECNTEILNDIQLIVAKHILMETKKVIQYDLYREQKAEIKSLNEKVISLKGEVERLETLLSMNGINFRQTALKNGQYGLTHTVKCNCISNPGNYRPGCF